MSKKARWTAVAGMIAVLCVLFLVTAKTATQFALVILLTLIGYGFNQKKFSLK